MHTDRRRCAESSIAQPPLKHLWLHTAMLASQGETFLLVYS